jgi:hypothetical protein
MGKVVLITSALLASGTEALAKAIIENPRQAAEDVLVIAEKAEEQVKVAMLEIKKLGDDLHDKDAVLNEALNMNEKLSIEIEKLSTLAPVASPSNAKTKDLKSLSFQDGEDKYGFKFFSMYHKNVRITAVEVTADESLQKELIAISSGMIYKK